MNYFCPDHFILLVPPLALYHKHSMMKSFKQLCVYVILIIGIIKVSPATPGGSSLGGVLNLRKSNNNASEYAFQFEDEHYMDVFMNYLKYQAFLNRMDNNTTTSKRQ